MALVDNGSLKPEAGHSYFVGETFGERGAADGEIRFASHEACQLMLFGISVRYSFVSVYGA